MKGSFLDVIGVIKVEITLPLLKDRKLAVNLFLVKDLALAADILLGWKFIAEEK